MLVNKWDDGFGGDVDGESITDLKDRCSAGIFDSEGCAGAVAKGEAVGIALKDGLCEGGEDNLTSYPLSM